MPPDLLRRYAAHRQISVEAAETEITSIIDDVGGKLAHKHAFGYHQRSDMVQQAHVEAQIAFRRGDYDPTLPLANFLFSHVANRFSNLRRRQLFRGERPCKCCGRFDPPATPCPAWVRWNQRNVAKQKIMSPVSLSHDSLIPARDQPPDQIASHNELRRFILDHLPVDLRDDFYLFEIDSDQLPPKRGEAMRATLAAILEGTPHEPAH